MRHNLINARELRRQVYPLYTPCTAHLRLEGCGKLSLALYILRKPLQAPQHNHHQPLCLGLDL